MVDYIYERDGSLYRGFPMNTKIYDIADGIKLHAIKSDRFKTDYLSFNFINKLDKSTASLYSLLPKVLYRGTRDYPTMEKLASKLDFLYASSISTRIMKRGDTQYVTFNSNMLSEEYVPQGTNLFDKVFDVLRGIIFEPYMPDGCFCKEYVESEKSNLIDEIKSLINEKDAYARHMCIKVMCDKEIYSTEPNGTAEDVEKITPESLFSAYRKFLSESKIEIYFIGSADAELTAEKLCGIFSGIKRSPAHIGKTEIVRSADKVREVSEECGTSQSKLIMGFRYGAAMSDGDFSKYLVMTEVLGGSSTSKLFMNVREKMSLCYYCGASSLSQKGIMLVNSGIEASAKEQAQKEILRQLEEIRLGNISDDEINNAKKAIISEYDSICDYQNSIELWLISRYDCGLSDSIEDEISHLENVSKEDIMNAAEKVCLDTVFFLKGTKSASESADNCEEDGDMLD